MKERPIIFSAPMVRAILAGTKTVTRRIVTPQPHRVGERRLNCAEPGNPPVVVTQLPGWEWKSTYAAAGSDFAGALAWHSPYGRPGDRLWVKETFTYITGNGIRVHYRADGEPIGHDGKVIETEPGLNRWMSPIFMPRRLSRIRLELVSAGVERVQDITDDDARREGVQKFFERFQGIGRDQRITDGRYARDEEYRASFACSWDEINGHRALWNTNPWVWVVEFKRVVDEKAKAA